LFHHSLLSTTIIPVAIVDIDGGHKGMLFFLNQLITPHDELQDGKDPRSHYSPPSSLTTAAGR
jgi:hypothetical protein